MTKKKTVSPAVLRNLKNSMSEELQAARRYWMREGMAMRAGDTVTAKLYKRIALEEKKHYDEYKARLAKLAVR